MRNERPSSPLTLLFDLPPTESMRDAAASTHVEACSICVTPIPSSSRIYHLLESKDLSIPTTLAAHHEVEELEGEGEQYLVIKNLTADPESFSKITNAFGFHDYPLSSDPSTYLPIYMLQLLPNLMDSAGFPRPHIDSINDFQKKYESTLRVILDLETGNLYLRINTKTGTSSFTTLRKQVEDSYLLAKKLCDDVLETHRLENPKPTELNKLILAHTQLISALGKLEKEAYAYLDLFESYLREAKSKHVASIEAEARKRREAALAKRRASEAAASASGGAGASSPHSTPPAQSSVLKSTSSLFHLDPLSRDRIEKEATALREDKLNALKARQAKEEQDQAKLSSEDRRAQTSRLFAEKIYSDGQRFFLVKPVTPRNPDFINIFSSLGLYAPTDDEESSEDEDNFLESLFALKQLEDLIDDLNENNDCNFLSVYEEDFIIKVNEIFCFIDDEGIYSDGKEGVLGKSDAESESLDTFPFPASRKTIQDFYNLIHEHLFDLYKKSCSNTPDKLEALTKVYNSLVISLHAYKESAFSYHALIKKLATPKDAEKEAKKAALLAKMKAGEHPGADRALSRLAKHSLL